MANYDRGKSKRKGSSCQMCKPQKAKWAKKRGKLPAWTVGSRAGRWVQENKGHLTEKEQLAAVQNPVTCPSCGKDGVTEGCVWCGMPCPEESHDWDSSDLEGSGWIRCRVCLADGYVEPTA
jgi:hypothetical protein